MPTSVLDSTRVSGLATSYGHNAYAELASSAAWYGADSLLTEYYDRDNLGRITRIVETTAAGTTDRGYHYFHDRGQLEAVRDSLTHVDIARYRYDANGNRLGLLTATDSVSAAYDAQDRLVDRGTAHYTYTANGERLTRTQSGATVSTTYDLLGNLVQVKLASGDSVEYVVDGRNRRVGRKFNGTLTARWVYANDLSVVGELDTVGVLTKRFVYASSSHVPDLMVVRNPSGPDSTYRFVTDHLGSVRLVVNANTGFVAQRLAYDAWGAVTTDTRPGFTPFGYAGGLYDPATALVRFGARDYDPEAGVWTSKDPLGLAGGSTDLTTYVSGDPVNAVDPSGMWCLPASELRDALKKLWNGPNSILGASYGSVGLAFGARLSLGNNAIQFLNDPVVAPGYAITLGNVTIYGRGADPADPTASGASMGQHEMQHTIQGEQLGPLYLPSNLVGGVAALAHDHDWHGPTNWNERGPQMNPPRPW